MKREFKMWGVFNLDRLIFVQPRRRDAIQAAEQWLGWSWSKIKKSQFITVEKVTVSRVEGRGHEQ